MTVAVAAQSVRDGYKTLGRFRGLILHAGQTTVDFEGWRHAFQPESLFALTGSSQAVAQAVTDELAVDELAVIQE